MRAGRSPAVAARLRAAAHGDGGLRRPSVACSKGNFSHRNTRDLSACLPLGTNSPSALPTPPIACAEQFARRNTDIAHFQVHSLDEFKARIPEAHVVVVSMMWRNEFAEIASKLQFIQSISAGLDQYDRDLLGRRRIRLASAAGVNAEAVAQHAMALILALKRQLHTGRDNQAAKVWRGMISEIGAREDQLNGKTLLIVGIGRIGSALARLAQAFEMRVIATRRDPSAGAQGAHAVYAHDRLPELLPQADIVALTCPLTPQTENLIDAKAISLLKPIRNPDQCRTRPGGRRGGVA